MRNEQSATPFPIRAFRVDNGVGVPPGTIPFYWAMIIRKLMVRHYGNHTPSIEQIAEQGGFDPAVALDLLAGGVGTGDAFRKLISNQVASIKDSVHIVTPGTRAYDEARKELLAEAAQRRREADRFVFGHGSMHPRTTR